MSHCSNCNKSIEAEVKNRLRDSACLEHSIKSLYTHHVNDDIVLVIGKEIGLNGQLSDHMAILLIDNKHNNTFAVKLSTFRSILKFIIKKNWFEPRKMTDKETKKMYKIDSFDVLINRKYFDLNGNLFEIQGYELPKEGSVIDNTQCSSDKVMGAYGELLRQDLKIVFTNGIECKRIEKIIRIQRKGLHE